MKYKITLKGKTYEVLVEQGEAIIEDEYDYVPPVAPVAAAPAAEPAKAEKPGPKYTRELKLWDTDPRDAAMIMAIVAETTQIPLKELQFLSIKEIKGDNQE